MQSEKNKRQSRGGKVRAPRFHLLSMPSGKDKRQSPPQHRSQPRSLWRWLMGIWLLLVAGLPIYYLLPNRDWYYGDWGEPQKILESHQISENPLYKDEGVYTRVFIVRPSEENLDCFRSLPFEHCIYSESVEPLLKEYGLPAPYRFANSGCVNFVLCGNGLMLVHDFSRNKGGLFSSRLAQPEGILHSYPLSFVICYVWAEVSWLVLFVLTPVLVLLSPLLFLLWKALTLCIGVLRRSIP